MSLTALGIIAPTLVIRDSTLYVPGPGTNWLNWRDARGAHPNLLEL